MCGSFLWSGSHKANASWEDILLPKKEGGLRIRRLHEVSRVFTLSLIWKLFTLSSSLWGCLDKEVHVA